MNDETVGKTVRKEIVPGTELRGEQDDYILEEYLGQGATAIVYRGTKKSSGENVAIKILHPEASKTTTGFFWHESTVIGELQGRGANGVPRKLDQKRQGEVQFLVMELIERKRYCPIPDLLQTGPLAEQEALEIARQSLDLLDILHTQVGRTYVDMQLKNFWWDAKDKALKVMDWNHVSWEKGRYSDKEWSDLVRKDLALFAAFLYQMLTGKGASAEGEAEGVLSRRAGPGWDSLSLAAREVLVRALHPNPERRYPTAAEFSRAIQDVQELWEWGEEARKAYDRGNGETFMIELEERLKKAENVFRSQGVPDQNLLDLARRLDIVARKKAWEPVKTEAWQAKLSTWTKAFSQNWNVGMRYFESRNYAQAYEMWLPEAKDRQRLDLWRWVMLAEAGKENEAFVQEQNENLTRLLEALEADKPQEAVKLVASMPSSAPTPVKILAWEAKSAEYVSTSPWEGEKTPKEWEDAAERFGEIARELNSLEATEWSDYASLLKGGWGDLEKKAKMLAEKAGKYLGTNKRLEEYRQKLIGDPEKDVEELKLAIRQDPENAALMDLVLAYVRGELIQKGVEDKLR